jgi:alcohol dehydrogenase/L-iditol 2-dehydrogenase
VATQPAVVQYALAAGSVELREVAVPAIGDEDVLLAVGAVSVCGSDVHQAYGSASWPINVPVTLGHEFGGTIAALGRAVRGFREGDRVVSETAAVICGACGMCRSGRYNLCPSRKGFGYGVDGAMASLVAVPARCLHRVPDTLPFDLACLTEPHAVAYNAMCVNATIRPGDLVVVLGPGPIGLLCTRMAALAGAHPLVVSGLAADAARLETATALGATHVVDVQAQDLAEVVRGLRPLGADLVCDASGSSRTLEAALSVVRPDGRVVKVGWSPESLAVNLNPLVQKNLAVQGSFSHTWPVWERVIELLDAGLTRAELVVGLRTGLEGWKEAFEGMHTGAVIKSVLVPGAAAGS